MEFGFKEKIVIGVLALAVWAAYWTLFSLALP